MLLSLFTPSHDTRWLHETYQSLRDQTHAHWEWVVLLNRGAELLPNNPLTADTRVKVIHIRQLEKQPIGLLKKWAVSHCSGDLLVELDHDDLLAPQALQRILQAAESSKAGFLHSDWNEFYANASDRVYSSECGWEHYRHRIGDKMWRAMRAFPLSARSLHEIYWAPNHVRVWTRQAYEKAGGHDVELAVADDHDLICRTYLAGVPFEHIPEPLYLYRLHEDGSNTHVRENAKIQEQQRRVSNRYTYPLVQEWCRRNHYELLDLGAAHGKPDGFVGIDREPGADIQADVFEVLQSLTRAPQTRTAADEYGLQKPIGCIRATDFLEHVPRDKVVKLMNLIYEVLVPGGWLITATPSTDGRGAFQDPTHVSWWNENNFWYFTRRQQAKYVPAIKCRFQAARIWTACPSEWHEQHNIPYVHADLIALKGQRQPGYTEI